ncbi:MAG: BLUF domain-containing protein [Rhizobiales bacterium]|nr:BLUF domain-containing protein [Hyphomicrobiales bacterium]
MITQLVYTSSASFDPRSESGRMHVSDIIATARQHNGANDITGFLIVGSDWFAQVLEGEAQAITSLFRRILADRRHIHVKLVETRFVRERLFPDWAMGYSHGPMLGTPLSAILQRSAFDSALDFPFDRIIRHAQKQAEITRLSTDS